MQKTAPFTYSPNPCPQRVTATYCQHPYGMLMDGRSYTSSDYRFGFGGQEKDQDINSNGNVYTAQFWEYDCRIGRRWNVDPITKFHRSPYNTFNCNPIIFIDPLGNTDYYNISGHWIGTDGVDNGYKKLVLSPKTEDYILQLTIEGKLMSSNMSKFKDIIEVPSMEELDIMDEVYMRTLYNGYFREQGAVVGENPKTGKKIDEWHYNRENSSYAPQDDYDCLKKVGVHILYDIHSHPPMVMYKDGTFFFGSIDASSYPDGTGDIPSSSEFYKAYGTSRPNVVLSYDVREAPINDRNDAKSFPNMWIGLRGDFEKMITYYDNHSNIATLKYSTFKSAVTNINSNNRETISTEFQVQRSMQDRLPLILGSESE